MDQLSDLSSPDECFRLATAPPVVIALATPRSRLTPPADDRIATIAIAGTPSGETRALQSRAWQGRSRRRVGCSLGAGSRAWRYHEVDELPDDVGEAMETLMMRVVREDRSAA
jgi:hypothetical protein